jgi:hypothetical protein
MTSPSLKVAILQPNYIPWKGVFDMVHAVDVFVFLDDVQYTVRDWRNRNKVKTLDGQTAWLSVPVLGGRNQAITEVVIDQAQPWAHKHTEVVRHSYGKTPFYGEYAPRFAEILGRRHERLADLDIDLMREVCGWLGIPREFRRSSELAPEGTKDDRLIDLVRKVGGDHYLSGPAARAYIRPERFAEAGITLGWQDYTGYPEYPQIAGPFDHAVTVLDLLFAVGPAAPEYIWGHRRAQPR